MTTSADDLEAALLGAPCTLTRDEVRAAVGVSEDEARAIWVALGFAEVPPGERAFTVRDVEALRRAIGLRGSGVVDADTVVVIARAMGQHLAGLAEAQVEVFRRAAVGMSRDEAAGFAAGVADDMLPVLEHLVVHVWRRQFAVATQSALAATEEGGQRVRAVGFVDLVDFTRSSRSWDTPMLARTLERFESEAARRVATRKGRVVKTLGDAIMYVIDDADAAVEVALETVAAHDADDDLPKVRSGVALGPVLQRVGDVFGECVNIASRLTAQARPSSVLIDRELAAALDDDPRFNLRRLRKRSVRGYRTLTPWLVRLQDPDAADVGSLSLRA